MSIIQTSHIIHVGQDNDACISYNRMTGMLAGRFFDDFTIERLKAMDKFIIDIKVTVPGAQPSQSKKLRQKTLQELWSL